MYSSTLQKCQEFLIHDLKGIPNGRYIQKIQCPACGKFEAFTEMERPWNIFCQRGSKCYGEFKVKELRPDLFSFKPDINLAPTDLIKEYLNFRGIDYSKFQGKIEKGETEKNGRMEPVIFFKLEDGGLGGRLITYKGKDKSHFPGGSSPSKTVYSPLPLDTKKELWLVEGPMDALSLCQEGHQAISILSSNYKPENNEWIKEHLGNFKEVILAFDNDKAGFKACENWFSFCRKNNIRFKIATPPNGQDWNDLLVIDSLKQEEISRAFTQGELTGLEVENNPIGYFERIRGEYHSMYFPFREKTYCGFMEEDKAIAKCILDGTAYPSVVEVSGEDFETEKITVLNLKVPGDVKTYRVKLDYNSITKPDHFKGVVAKACRAIYEPKNHSSFMKYLIGLPVREIRNLSFMGLDSVSGHRVFNHFAVSPKGEVTYKNSDGFIPGINVVPFKHHPAIKKIGTLEFKTFFQLLYDAFGEKGLLSLGFYVASLERDFILEQGRGFPFLSLTGEHTTGKTSLLTRLNTAICFDKEDGINASSGTTFTALLRNLSHRSGLPSVISEVNRGAKLKIDWNQFLQISDGGDLKDMGMKTLDNRTVTIKSRTTVALTSNFEPFPGKAHKSRAISYHFRPEDNNSTTREAYNKLLELSGENSHGEVPLASIGLQIIQKLHQIKEKIVPRWKKYTDHVGYQVENHDRVPCFYALPMALVDILVEEFGLDGGLVSDCLDYTIQRTKDKLADIEESPTEIQEFFQVVKDTGLDGPNGNYYIKEDKVFIHLPNCLANISYKLPIQRHQIIAMLKNHRAYLDYSTQWWGESHRKCYVFYKEKLEIEF